MSVLPSYVEEAIRFRAGVELELKQRTRANSLICSDPVEWIERHFRIPETSDNKIVMQPYQKRVLRETLTLNAAGEFPYSTIVWSDIKKSAKSTITAAVALWRAFQVDWGQVVMVANDLKQADSRVGYYLRRAIELNPNLAARAKIRNYQVTLDNHTRIEAVPIDPTGEAGGGADMVVFSELWGAFHAAQARMWTEMTLSPLKYGQSFRWVETYAGYSGESPTLEQLHEVAVQPENRVAWANEFNPALEAYTAEQGRIFCLWNTVPRNPWQTKEYYAQEEATLMPDEFRRVHKNEFVSSTSAFVPREWWAACLVPDEEIPDLTADMPMILAADASIDGDTFGLLGLTGRDGSGIYDIRYVNAWRPPPNASMENGIDYTEIEDEIRRLVTEYNVVELAVDPYQLYYLGNKLNQELVTRVYFFSQGADRLVADKGLQDRIRGKQIAQWGDPVLTEHILNANAKIDKEGGKLRIIKRSPQLKIDLAVCLSMAADRAAFWQL